MSTPFNPRLIYRFNKRIKKWMYARLISAGIRPMNIDIMLKKVLYELRYINITDVIKRVKNSFRKKSPKRYLIPATTIKSDTSLVLHKDNLNDLLQFKSKKRIGISRKAFMADAMYRFEIGEHCFTWMENNHLLGCTWIRYPYRNSADDNKDITDFYINVKKVYCQVAGREQLQTFIKRVVDVAITESGRNYFVTDDPLFCKGLEAIGIKIDI